MKEDREKEMKRENNKYIIKAVIALIYSMSPFWTVLRFILSVIEGLVSSGLLALAVANFVDKALFVIGNNGTKRDIYPSLIILLVVFGAFITIGSIEKMVDAKIRLDITNKMKPDLIKVQATLDYKYIENDKNWELISRVMRDPAASLTDGFGAFILVVQIFISIFSVLGLLITNAWWAVLVIVAFSVPLFKLAMYAGKKNYRAAVEAEKYNRRTEYLDTLLTGRDNIEERTVFGYGRKMIDVWKEQYETGRKLQLKVALKQFITMKASSLILASISLLIALTLVKPVVDGVLSIGLFIGIISSVFGIINRLAYQMTSAMERISKIIEYMKDYYAMSDLDRVYESLVAPMPSEEFESLEFRNVSFKYPSGDDMILKDISFTIKKGKHYAFVGKNGAGKSTVTKLITGLYTDYTGQILLNGRDIKSYSLGNLKSMFSVVYQDFAKYSISMRDNIAIGNINNMDKTSIVENVIGASGLEDVVAGLNRGIETPLGKVDADGQELSGGQWQRIAIARTLFSDAGVRILDEPTSALDPIRESEIYHDFERIMDKKTTIFISHRLGSTKLADEILVIDDGKVAEQGSHGALMSLGGIYAQMYDSQRSWYK